MSIRTIALAIPLVLGIACKTSSTQASKDHTGAMWTERSASNVGASRQDTAAVQPASMQGTGSQGGSMGGSQPDTMQGAQGQGQGQGSAAPSGSDSGAMGSGGSSESMGSSQQGQAGSPDSGQGASGTSASGSSDAAGSGMAGAAGAAGSSDLGGHSDDQTVTGTVSKFAKRSISIAAPGGEAKTLKIVPRTVVTMNGKTAKPSQIKPGQQVRASYNQQGNQDVAVTIDVSGAAAGSGQHKTKGHHGGTSGASGSGSDSGTSGASSGPSGSGGSDTTGTTGPPGSGTRRY